MIDPWQLVGIILAIGGAIVAGWAASSRPALAIFVLFFLSSQSRIVVETAVGTMRIEQPAIAVVAIVLLARGRLGILRQVTPTGLVVAGAFAAYLGVLALSSAVVAPQPTDSLRIVAWLLVSMVGGVVVCVLALPDPSRPVTPFAAVGGLSGAIGIVLASLFLVFGPTADWGIQEAGGILPRVHAFAWEANIYASFLVMTIPFGLEAARGPVRWRGYLFLALMAVGVMLGSTRAAYLAIIAAVIAYAAVRLATERRLSDLPRLGAALAGALAVGLLATRLLLPNAIDRYLADNPPAPVPTATPSGPTATGGVTASGEPIPTATPTPTPQPIPSLRPYPDTISFRLDRVPVALADLGDSPIIGLGAESFGQRHADPSQDGDPPDHLAILAVAAVYDAGVLGAAALAIAFLVLLVGLWRTVQAAGRSGDRLTIGIGAACIAAIVALIVSSQATNALHFASNWMIIGAAVAVLGSRRRPLAP